MALTDNAQSQKELVEEIKDQWKTMWSERLDDNVSAEGIANQDFSLLLWKREQ